VVISGPCSDRVWRFSATGLTLFARLAFSLSSVAKVSRFLSARLAERE